MPLRDEKTDFPAGYRALRTVPIYEYSQLFDDPEIRERVGALIARALDHALESKN